MPGSYDVAILYHDLRHLWDSSPYWRALIWLMLVYGLITAMIVVVEVAREMFKVRVDRDDGNALLLLWATALILVTVLAGSDRILAVIPPEREIPDGRRRPALDRGVNREPSPTAPRRAPGVSPAPAPRSGGSSPGRSR